MRWLDQIFAHRFAPFMAFFVLALAGGYFFNHEVSQVRSAQRAILAVQHKQTKGIRSSCERTDALLAASNRSNKANYEFARTAIIYLDAFRSTGSTAVIQRLQDSLESATWIPLIDCTRPPVTYQLGLPVSFTQQLPPPFDLFYTSPGS